MLDAFLLKDRRAEGLNTLTEKIKDFGRRLHWSVGVLAVLLILIYVLRFLLRLLGFL